MEPTEIQEYIDIALPYAMSLLQALATLIIGWMIAGWARKLVMRGLNKAKWLDDTLKPVIGSIVRYTILVFVLIAVLSAFGVETTSIIAALGAAGLAIGLALQGTLSNIAAGFMLLFLRPFRAGDFIDAEGYSGTVVEISLFTTELKTFDGVFLLVPNAQIWNKAIKNFSRNDTRRIDVLVGVSYDDDIPGAKKVLMDILKQDSRILGDPEPMVMVTSLGDSSVNINMRCWVNAADYWAVLFDLNEQGKIKIEDAGYSIPFPQRDLHIKSAPSVAEVAGLPKAG